MSSYDDLSREQMIELLKKRDRTKKLGLVWERDEIEADNAVDANFVAATIIPDLSDKPAPWRNMVIEGDNFDALRWLRMTLPGKVKCIYIDPPYNTGNKDWVYNDHYMDPEDRFRHSTWLEFLYRRLSLARDLLTDDGVILVSINDDQRAKLELLMDEALPGMKIGSFVWRTRTGGNEGGESFFTINHEHVLIYAKSGFRFSGTKKSFEMYSNPDNDPRGDWRKDNLTVAVGYTNPRAGKAYYPLRDPATDVWYACNPDRVWIYASKEHSGAEKRVKTKFMEDWIADGQIVFPDAPRVHVWETKEDLLDAIRAGDVPKSGQTPLLREGLPNLDFWVGKRVGFGTPAFKRYKEDLRNPTQPLSSWIIPRSEEHTRNDDFQFIVSGTNDEGAKVIKSVFGSKAFDYAKPVSLIRELVRQSTSSGDVVLDFFAGSATTAQAVMELNVEDGGGRRFVMVSSSEATGDQPDKNLCRDVTAERIRRINKSEDPKFADLAAEFAYLRCEEIDFEDLDHDLQQAQVWAALETIHDLPLTLYSGGHWQEHRTEELTLVFADRVNAKLIDHLEEIANRRENAFVYAWAPGQITQAIGDVLDVRSVREELVGRFRQ
ncbi:site-specific DNA-methyltransferase (plasmid) [Rhizobium ruizarguesonis]|uniref:site-specific DNA-methyltransferase n=1 Tax=Rhizobium ruizarguesonis TaxID=2081791 RepID=UPI001032025F|nr:site-specific DNA-methyltransferase [Rhizobium ruizarguesonis]TAZ71097.1 site-specific DNA-methyltransferase [Rhizobium ruizarguesonis]